MLNAATIAALKRSHQYLLSGIDAVNQELRNFTQAWPCSRELDQRLLNHLSRQDPAFYKELRDAVQNDRPSFKMLDFLEHDLKEFKIELLRFSETYFPEGGGIPQGRNFNRDFLAFRKVIIERIEMEEQYLLPMLSSVVSDPCQES